MTVPLPRAAEDKATGEAVIGFENRFATRDGSWRYISWAAKPVLADRTVYSVGRDVTELKQAQADLQQAKDHLELQVRERTEELVRANEDLKREIRERKKTMRANQPGNGWPTNRPTCRK